ncbi:inositol 1,4,5-trisphosphate-gated calcium channel ITPR3-like isoform X9 [Mytilus galloprovincialis]|uniref:inositol 1,4,5-trisphosphate-gated calcium channel ITPR3-like isoform X9 n=1 Tax=Mytilus galloprovincialis TaxID=29158 RepID=UPI003F7BED29
MADENLLTVGDKIFLYAEHCSGFLHSFQSSSVHNEVAVGCRQDRVKPDIKDQHIISFTLRVANRYKLNKKFNKQQTKLEAEPENILLRTQVAHAKLAADSENDDNNLEQKRQQGKKVVYGQVIQLQHSFTQKYIHVSTTKTSSTESNNMAVELLESNAKHCQFKIMPRYKVKAEGDVVQVDDQIVLESMKSPGSFLHVSKAFLGPMSVYSKSFELNLSVQQTGFTVYRKYKPHIEDDNKVRVGDIIRFYHKEMEAYLVAEGLFDDELLEDVHLRMRPMDQNNPKTLFPSTSAVTYWQIELQTGPIDGGVLKWEQQCRIIHMCSRKYLTVDKALQKVTLTGDHMDPNTVFRIHPVIREYDEVPLDSYCRIEHVVSKRWLHALTVDYVRKCAQQEEDSSMGSLKWSTATLKQISTIEEKQYDDAFTIQGVSSDLVEIFDYMAGMVPFIQKLIGDKKDGVQLNAKMTHDAVVALSELKDFMIVDSLPNKNRQKLMRNLRIVELLVYLLQIPFRGTADQHHLTRIFVEAYDVLYTYLKGDSRKNELYIAKYIDFFLSQFEYKEGMIGLNSAHMVMELIKDNRKIVDRITTEHIDKFVELLRRDKNYRYLDLLKVLCVCDGVSIADNQKYITEVWLMKGNRNCVFYTDLGQKIGKEKGVVYVSTTTGRTWMELSKFAQKSSNDDELYLFLEHQLELFGYLCNGQNDFSIKVITQELNYLTWDEAFTCVSDDRLPDELRAQYCDLIITMFVNVGDNHSVIDRVKLTYNYDEIDDIEGKQIDRKSLPIVKVVFDEYPEKNPEAFERMLNGNNTPDTFMQESSASCRVSRLSNNEMSRCQSRTRKFKPRQQAPQLTRVRTTLDGKDLADLSHSITSKYFPTLSEWIAKFLGQNSDMTASEIGNNKLVKQVLRLVHFLVAFGFYQSTEDIMTLLEPMMGLIDGRNDKPYPVIPPGKEGEEVLKNFRLNERYHPSQETQAVVDAKCQALEVLDLFFNFIFNVRLEKFMNTFKLTHTAANRPNLPHPELAPMLYETYDLSNQHGVSKAAVKKTKDIFYQTDYIKTYDLVSILRDLSFYQYDEMVRMSMALLNRYYSSYNHLFTRAVQAQVLITDKSTEVFETLEKILPKLRRFATAKLNETQTKELCDILTKLIEMCHLEGEIEEQHGMNQSILYNHGILEDCFTILSQEIDVKLLDQYTGQRRVYQLTFTLLKMMARQNKTVQGRLFDRLDMLLSKEGAGTELAECLTEVFTGNSNTCMKVTGNQIQKIMELVSKNRESVPQFLDLLNAIVKVEELDLPLKRNQGFVMNYFMQYRAEVAFVIDQDEAARFQILTDPRHKHLQYLIAMVDMLATCAEGENRFIESICQTIFKIPELLKILSSPSINNNLKKPFLRFFLWVYLNTAGGMIESGAGDLPHEKSMWVYINGMNPLLKEIADFARKDPKTTKTFLKRPPAKGDTGTSGNEAINGSIHYLFDSVMPFLQIFCRNYYQPDPSVFPDEPQHLDDLTRNFKDFMEEIAPLVSIERQMKSIVACTMSLLSASTLPVNEMREFEDKYAKGVQGQEVKSDARRSYEEYYQYEEEINRQLNVFAVNMKTAYGGLNTVHAQIGYNSDADYSEIDGDEELPLGQEFQDHITFFIDTGHKDARSRYAQAEKLVKQLSISAKRTHLNEKEKLDQIELDVKCLQLLRALIYNEIVKLPEDWESEAARHRLQLHAISDVQDALNSYDVVTSVLDHLSRPQDNVVREVLAFMATLLFNGNDCVQDNLISYFTGTREETFFFSIKSRMQLSAIATREKRLLHAMHQAKMEEAMQQAKALQKAMQTGQMATIEIMKANKIGSMLSMAKKSMANLRQSGFLRPASRLGIGGSKTSMGKKQNFGSSRLLKPSKLSQNGQAGKKLGSTVNQVAPVTDVPEVQIENIDEEELQELMQHALEMSSEFDFRDDGYIELVLRILGLMCDNQHNDLQNYLREQPDNIKSVNLVAETTKFLQIVYSNINDKSLPLVVQLFDTLVEFTSGNQQNQAVIFDHKICDYINHILRVGQFKGCGKKEVYVLKKSIATLVRSLTEENPKDSDEDNAPAQGVQIATLSKHGQIKVRSKKEVMEYLDTPLFISTMTEAYQDMQRVDDDPILQKGDCDFEELKELISEVGFAYYHILSRMSDLDDAVNKDTLIKPDTEQDMAWESFSENTLSIEILKDDVLQKIYFPVQDKNVLRDEIKDKFKYEVDRSSPSNKIRDFMDWASDIIHDIQYQRKIHSYPLARLLIKLWIPMNYMTVFLSFVIAVLVMIFWRDPLTTAGLSDSYSAIPRYTNDEVRIVIYVLGGIHNFLSLCILITFYLSNHPTFPVIKAIKGLIIKYDDDDDTDDMSWLEKKKDYTYLEVKAYGVNSIYYVVFLAFSVLGTAFYGYFFAFHLLHIAVLNQLLKRVIQAVTTNGTSLLLVGMLGMVIIFIYALLSFAVLRERFLEASKGRDCTTVYECFITVLHHGFVDSLYTSFEGNMGDWNTNFKEHLILMAVDLSFFIIVTTIGLNIIFGIIVDTFSQLRDSKWEIDKDMMNNCFICSRESYDFERQLSGGFEKHVKEEHNQWAYLFFFLHLDNTRVNDYSALELYVYKLLQEANFDFFPLNQALSLLNEEDSQEVKLQELGKNVDYMVNKMKEEEASKERDRERQKQLEWEIQHRKAK